MYVSHEIHRDDSFMSSVPKIEPSRWPLAASVAAGFFAGLVVYGAVVTNLLPASAPLLEQGVELMGP
jgi:hypothetical protein